MSCVVTCLSKVENKLAVFLSLEYSASGSSARRFPPSSSQSQTISGSPHSKLYDIHYLWDMAFRDKRHIIDMYTSMGSWIHPGIPPRWGQTFFCVLPTCLKHLLYLPELVDKGWWLYNRYVGQASPFGTWKSRH